MLFLWAQPRILTEEWTRGVARGWDLGYWRERAST